MRRLFRFFSRDIDMKTIFYVLALMLFAALASAEDSGLHDYYTDGEKRGWWWGKYKAPYEQQAEEKKDSDKTQNDPLRVVPSQQHSRPTVEELKNMPPKQLGEILQQAREIAVQTPSENNVLWYYTVQDVVRRKSLAFMNVSEYVWQKHPELNAGTAYPVAAPGQSAMVRQTREEVESAIRLAQNDFALLYFYAPGCPYCEAQDGILQFFVTKYGWQIQFVEIGANRRLAASLGIDTTPSLVLIKNGSKDFIPVSEGVVSLTEIEDKLYRGIRLLQGEITPEEYSIYDREKGGPFDVNATNKTDKQ